VEEYEFKIDRDTEAEAEAEAAVARGVEGARAGAREGEGAAIEIPREYLMELVRITGAVTVVLVNTMSESWSRGISNSIK
jgi:hypothetical protein